MVFARGPGQFSDHTTAAKKGVIRLGVQAIGRALAQHKHGPESDMQQHKKKKERGREERKEGRKEEEKEGKEGGEGREREEGGRKEGEKKEEREGRKGGESCVHFDRMQSQGMQQNTILLNHKEKKDGQNQGVCLHQVSIQYGIG